MNLLQKKPELVQINGLIQISPIVQSSAQAYSQVCYKYLQHKYQGPGQPGFAWAVYGGNPDKLVVQAAFTHEELAKMLATYLNSVVPPALLPQAEISVSVDQYAQQIAKAYKPYYIKLIDGNATEIYKTNNEKDIRKIIEVSYDQGSHVLQGTFWESRKVLA